MDDGLTYKELWADFAAAQQVKQPPPGAKTIREVAQMTGKSDSQTERVLTMKVEAGIMKRGKFKNPNGRGYPFYYWFV